MIVQEMLSIGDAQPGMRLAVAITDDAGHLLVPAATELTDKTLESLRRRGVEELHIEREVVVDPEMLAARQAEAEQHLAKLFRKAGEGQETKGLHQAILAFRLERSK